MSVHAQLGPHVREVLRGVNISLHLVGGEWLLLRGLELRVEVDNTLMRLHAAVLADVGAALDPDLSHFSVLE